MIVNFWNWIMQSVTAAVQTLENIYSNSTMQPFFNLFLVVIATMAIVKFIIIPITGGSGSDKAKKKKEDEE